MSCLRQIRHGEQYVPTFDRRLKMFLGVPGWLEILVIGLITLLIFGKRLPETMRSLGKGLIEFKKGIKGTEDEVKKAVSSEADSRPT